VSAGRAIRSSLLVVGLAAPAVALLAVAGAAHSTAQRATPPPEHGSVPTATRPTTPVLSLRRAPVPLSNHLRSARFATEIKPVVDTIGDRSCLVVLSEGTPIASGNATLPLVPASNMKLITAAVALDALGPDHTFRTEARGVVGPDGTVNRLVIVGGGDPLLSTAGYPLSELNRYKPVFVTPVETLLDGIAAAGVRSVTNLVGDESRYDTVRDAPSWGDAIETYNAARLSALMVNDGYLDNERHRNDSTAAGAVQVIRQGLIERGIAADLVAVGSSNGEPVIASVESAPLSDIVREMLTTSDNNTAELILKEVGKVVTGIGSTQAGLTVVSERLTAWGIPTQGLTLADGSGLSTENRVSCWTLASVLSHVGTTGPVYRGLPIAGETGTLSDYFAGSGAEGVMRAKTGNLTGARSLSGFFPGDDGQPLAFSFLVNGPNARQRAEAMWDDLASALDTYPQGAGADELSPLPPATP
jgi:D-alanyl-D-alanine carboxypeptidase/D-alanyl-D-alanine-endopeptidase (penicillin-binding protein 4)